MGGGSTDLLTDTVVRETDGHRGKETARAMAIASERARERARERERDLSSRFLICKKLCNLLQSILSKSDLHEKNELESEK